MLEGVLVASLICMVLEGLLAILCRFVTDCLADSAMCVALQANTTTESKKLCQESLKIIQN